MSFFMWYILSLLAAMITADDTNQPPRNASADTTSAEGLVILVSNLSKMLEDQQKAMLEFHSYVVKKLEEQTEMLTVLLKKGKGKGIKEASKDLLKITTLVPPLASPSNLVSLHPTVLPSNSNWSYSDHSTWVTDYPGCEKGNQSPVDLHTVDVALKDHKIPISFSSFDLVNKDTCLVANNGNTVTINMKARANSSYPIISGGPFNSTEYSFIQAVFHWGNDDTKGSEHTIRGSTYPLEMQLVHQTSSGEENKLAITSFLFEVSEEENPFLASLITAISKTKTVGTEAQLDSPVEGIEDENKTSGEKSQEAMDEFSMDLLIKDSISGPYFTYSGSLTYPPCTEVKQYVVFRVPLGISSTQLGQFRLLLQQDGTRLMNNFRPVKTLGDRVLAFTVGN